MNTTPKRHRHGDTASRSIGRFLRMEAHDMRRSRFSIFKALLSAAVVLLSIGVGSAQQRRQADIDLQAAIRIETVDGDLNAAIKQYEAIASKYKSDRAV